MSSTYADCCRVWQHNASSVCIQCSVWCIENSSFTFWNVMIFFLKFSSRSWLTWTVNGVTTWWQVRIECWRLQLRSFQNYVSYVQFIRFPEGIALFTGLILWSSSQRGFAVIPLSAHSSWQKITFPHDHRGRHTDTGTVPQCSGGYRYESFCLVQMVLPNRVTERSRDYETLMGGDLYEHLEASELNC